jgi:glucosylceramidase
MVLDETGGPWLVSEVHHDPDPNEQHPVVVINSKTKQVTYTGLYYYLAHFSKFVRPGAVRVGVTGAMNGVRCMAFEAKDGRLIAQVLNSRKQRVSTALKWRDRALNVQLPALSIATYIWSPARS